MDFKRFFAGVALIICLFSFFAGADVMKRNIKVSSLCLLEDEKYQTRSYVLKSLDDVESSPDTHLVVTPFMPFLKFREENVSEDLKDFRKWAKENSSILIVGLKEIAESGKKYHTSVIIDPDGKIAGKYRKTHRFTQDDTDFALGDDLPVFEVCGVKLGLTLTSDFYFMEVYNVLWMKGADVFVWQHYPEKLREHSAWHYLLHSRARDYACFLVTAMYADEATYLTNRRSISVNGSPFGRSMVISREGISLADTAYYHGIATVKIDLNRKKKNFDDKQPNALFTVPNKGDRKAFAPIAEPWKKPKVPKYKKRKARIAVAARMTGRNWSDDVYPQSVFNILKKAEEHKPDLILFSEENCKVSNPMTKKAMADVGKWAKKNKCYVVFAGLRDDDRWSIAWVWGRSGEIVFTEPIYWTKGIDEIKVFDTDFARIGIRVCGDIFIPEIDRILALKGAELILDPSWMWGPDGYHNERSSRSRAIDNGTYIASSHFHSSDFGLRNFLCDPYGVIISTAPYGEEELGFADIDFAKKKNYFSGVATDTVYEKGYDHYKGPVPERKYGWCDMIFHNRRPELYGIIPTQNEVTRSASGL